MYNVQVIAAEGEQKASRALRDAAEVIAESSSALQVKRLSLKERRLLKMMSYQLDP